MDKPLYEIGQKLLVKPGVTIQQGPRTVIDVRYLNHRGYYQYKIERQFEPRIKGGDWYNAAHCLITYIIAEPELWTIVRKRQEQLGLDIKLRNYHAKI